MSVEKQNNEQQVSETSKEMRWRMDQVARHASATGNSMDDSAMQFNKALRLLQSGETQESEG